VILMALKSGARLNEHKNAGRVSVHTVAGHIRMQVQDAEFDLPTGHMLALDREVIHNVEAVEDSAFVLTIALPHGNSEN
jgi:quercetin dioxygenase-like cupin family protein